MTYFLALLRGCFAEFGAILRVIPLLRAPFWLWYAGHMGCTLFLIMGEHPAVFSVLLSSIMLLHFAAASLFSGLVAAAVRHTGLVRYPDGPEVVPFLPQTIAVLTFPLYLLALMAFFRAVGALAPDHFPVSSQAGAAALVVHSVLRTEVFFDVFEVFRVRIAATPTTLGGRTLYFVTQTLLNLAFAKLAIQILVAAYYRARGIGRGEDVLQQLGAALKGNDLGHVRQLAQSVGDTLRESVDELITHTTGPLPKSGRAWRCLAVLRAVAVPYLQHHLTTDTGPQRETFRTVLSTIEVGGPPSPQAIVPRAGLRRGLLAGVGALVAAAWLLDGAAGLLFAGLLSVSFGVMAVRGRTWLDRLVEWGVLPPARPEWLPARMGLWALAVLPVLIAVEARFLQLAAAADPELFGATVGPASAFGYVIQNLTRTQVFLDVAPIFHLRVVPLQPSGVFGGLLALWVRTVFNLGILNVARVAAVVYFNRVFRGSDLPANAELNLRIEARACGPRSAEMIDYYFGHIRAFLTTAMGNPAYAGNIVAALTAAGIARPAPAEAAGGAEETESLLELSVELARLGRYVEAEAECRRADAILAASIAAGRADLHELQVFARHQIAGLLREQGRFAEAEALYRELIGQLRHLPFPEEVRRERAHAQLAVSLAKTLGGSRQLHLAEVEYVKALRVLEDLGKRGIDVRKELASAHGLLAAILEDLGRLAEGEAHYRQTVGILDSLPDERGGEMLGQALNNWGTILVTLARYAEAEQRFARSLTIRRELAREGNPAAAEGLAATSINIAELLQLAGRPAESEAHLRESLALTERLVREGHRESRGSLALARNNLGSILRGLGRFDEASAAYASARELFLALADEGSVSMRLLAASADNNLGNLWLLRNRPDEAEGPILRGLAALEALERGGQVESALELALARGHNTLGRLRQLQRRFDEALSAFTRGAGLLRLVIAAGQLNLRDELVFALTGLADLFSDRQRWADAEVAVTEGLATAIATNANASALWIARLRVRRGTILGKLGRHAEAVAELEASLAALPPAAPGVDPRTDEASAWWSLVFALRQLNRNADAEKALRRFIALREELDREAGQNASNERATAYSHLGALLFSEARPAEAAYRQAVALFDAATPLDRKGLALALANLATSLLADTQPDAAEAHYRRAIQVYSDHVRAGDAETRYDLGIAHCNLGSLLRRRARPAEAAAEYRLAVELLTQVVGAGRISAVAAWAGVWRSGIETACELGGASTLAAVNPMLPTFRAIMKLGPRLDAPARQAIVDLIALACERGVPPKELWDGLQRMMKPSGPA